MKERERREQRRETTMRGRDGGRLGADTKSNAIHLGYDSVCEGMRVLTRTRVWRLGWSTLFTLGWIWSAIYSGYAFGNGTLGIRILKSTYGVDHGLTLMSTGETVYEMVLGPAVLGAWVYRA